MRTKRTIHVTLMEREEGLFKKTEECIAKLALKWPNSSSIQTVHIYERPNGNVSAVYEDEEMVQKTILAVLEANGEYSYHS